MPATRAGLGNVAPAWYGRYGGAETAEELKGELEEIERAYGDMRKGDKELDRAMREYVGRPTPLMRAANLSNGLGEGKEVLLKREDLCHTGAHCMTAALGQAWLASRMGKGRVVAATASGQHGAATAASCALLGLKCDLFIGLKDAKRQSANVIFSEARGAVVHTVGQGLADAVKAAAEAWKEDPSGTFPSSFSAVGPHPFPWLVRDLQSRVGEEARSQSLEQLGRLPDALVACIGGGSNSLGLFHPFLPEPDVRLVGAEAAGRQPRTELSLHGARTLGLDAPSSSSSFSVGAGLDYPAVGPELAHLIVRPLFWLSRMNGIGLTLRPSLVVAGERAGGDDGGE